MKSKLAKKRPGKNQRPPDVQGTLIRCACGTICNLNEHRKCPECGEALEAPEVQNEEIRETQSEVETKTQKVGPPIETNHHEWMWKLAKYAAVMLVAAYALRLTLDWLHPSEVAQNTPAFSRAAIEPEVPSTPAPNVAPQAQRLSVDSRLVGDWEQFINGIRWSISIRSDGTYNFETNSPMQIPGHRGTFGAVNGRWELHSETIPWDDVGTYQVPNSNSFVMVGKLGTGMWARKGTQTSHFDPQPTPYQRSNYRAPAPTPANRTRGARRGGFFDGVFDDFAKRLQEGGEWLRR